MGYSAVYRLKGGLMPSFVIEFYFSWVLLREHLQKPVRLQIRHDS